MSIYDETGALVGCVDRAGFTGSTFQIEGWVNAAQITLVLGGQTGVAVPSLPRPDVAGALKLPANLGFFASVVTTLDEMRKSDAPGILCAARTGAPAIPPLSLPIARDAK